MADSVIAYVASFNTRLHTELCVRTLRATAPDLRLVVGDSASDDGSREMLQEFAARGWLCLHTEDQPVGHAEWLDRWIRTSSAARTLFVDSDMEFRRGWWLRRLLAVASRKGAHLVAGERVRASADFVEPEGGKTVYLAARPAPWLLLADVAALRALGTSFAFRSASSVTRREGLIAYDVGAAVHAAALQAGLRSITMPRWYRLAYTHHGGASWRASNGVERQSAIQRRVRDLARAQDRQI